MKTIAVDFDGVIHRYSKGWHDGTIYDEPVEGALDALKKLMETYAVFVFTSRANYQVADWLKSHGIRAVWEPDERKIHIWNNGGAVLVTSKKLPAVAYIDDRGIRFEGDWNKTLIDLSFYGVRP